MRDTSASSAVFFSIKFSLKQPSGVECLDRQPYSRTVKHLRYDVKYDYTMVASTILFKYCVTVYSGMTAIATYLLTKEIWNSGAGLFAACFIAVG